MDFKLLLFYFFVMVVVISASSDCKCDSEKKNIAKYKVKMSEGGADYEEDIEVDPEKQLEHFHIPKTPSSGGEVDVIVDFDKNMAMHRVAATNSCYLINSTDNNLKPKDLINFLDSKTGKDSQASQTAEKKQIKIVGTLHDRSILSDEMAALCAKNPIYRVILLDDQHPLSDNHMQSVKRKKRGMCLHCWCVNYRRYCPTSIRCYLICVNKNCQWVLC